MFKETYVLNKVNELTVVNFTLDRNEKMIQKISCWNKLKRIVAYVILFVQSFKRLVKAYGKFKYRLKLRKHINNCSSSDFIDVKAIKDAETFIY